MYSLSMAYYSTDCVNVVNMRMTYCFRYFVLCVGPVAYHSTTMLLICA